MGLRYFLLSTLLLAPATLVPQSPMVLDYSLLMAGNAAGKATERIKPDGSTEIEYSFNDRGRGPEIRGSYRFDARGFPASVELTGHDYLKAPVDERLSVQDGEARWRSRTEQGEAGAQGYYVSVNGPPAEAAWMVNALRKSPDQTIALLPAGEARLERGAETTLQDHGQSLKVTQFLITGLGFTPSSVWLDPAGWVQMIGLLALSDQGTPAYDHRIAAAFATLGIPTFACTPDRFPDLMSAAIKRQDLGEWASEQTD